MSDSANRRVGQVASHINHSAAYPSGLLNGEVAIVTGGGQGIGASVAKQFAKEGAKVIVSDVDKAKAEQVAQEIKQDGGEAIAVAGDVTDPKFGDNVVNAAVEKYGKLNHIVNNAGFTFDAMIHKMTDKQWDIMLAVHNTAPFRIIRAAAPHLRKQNGENKTITQISSTSGIHGNVGQINYATAKAGVTGMTKTIAKEWGQFGVRANTVAFGHIETRLTAAKEAGAFVEVDGQKVALGIPKKVSESNKGGASDIPLRRPGRADEAAAAVLLLTTPLASYITGHTLEVTGGRGI